jgi:predicted  nucleic acid-binding Zn-ribbon protein
VRCVLKQADLDASHARIAAEMQALFSAERDSRKREASAQARLRQANAETVRLQAQRNELQSRVRALEQQLQSAQRVNNEIFVRPRCAVRVCVCMAASCNPGGV